MAKPNEVSENPGSENNEAVPVDEGQSRQIGDLFNFQTGASPVKESAVEEPVAELGVLETEREEWNEPTPQEAPANEEEEEEEELEIPQPADELASVKSELAELKTLLAKLQPKDEPAPEPELPKIEVDPAEFLSEDEIDEFSVDPGKVLRALASRIYTRAREDSLKDMPGVVTKATQRQSQIAQAQTDFWSKNPELLKRSQEQPAVARLIRVTANEVQSQNPSWTIGQIFQETGKQVRQALNIAAEAKKIESSAKKPKQPSKPRSKNRGGSPADERSSEQKQLDTMISSVNR